MAGSSAFDGTTLGGAPLPASVGQRTDRDGWSTQGPFLNNDTAGVSDQQLPWQGARARADVGLALDSMNMHAVRRGTGKPLLLIHGLGGSWRSWHPVLDALAAEREVIAVDLPGFGQTPPLAGEVSIRTLCDATSRFIREQGLTEVDTVGSSMGARMVLELARRGGVLGGVVSLDPGGFWRGWERQAFYGSIYASIRLVRFLQPAMPFITRHALGRTLLLAQFSPRPWRLPPQVCLDEMRSYAASPSFDELLRELAFGEVQLGASLGSIKAPLAIGWGRHDRVCFTQQAARAVELFPDARLNWFERSGHFPHWDEPQACARWILDVLASSSR